MLFMHASGLSRVEAHADDHRQSDSEELRARAATQISVYEVRGRLLATRAGDKTHTIEFTLDGLSSTVESPVAANEAILDAALRVRGDVPFACAGGVCGTCRARVVEGDVRMTQNFALEPDEIARGYVLTCQSHPTAERVVVDYDV